MSTDSKNRPGGKGKGSKWRDDKNPPPPRVEDMLDRAPPCDVSAEMGVLGSILLLPDVANDLTLILRPDDFYDDANRKLYSHMMAMFDAGIKIDVMLLVSRLKQSGDYELVGGSAYLAKLAHSVANAAHAEYYAEIVRSKATFRKLIQVSTEILRDCYDEGNDAKEMLAQAEQKMFAIQDERSNQSAESINDLLTQALDRIDARLKGVHTDGGVDTYFTDYDAMSGGLHNGELIILAARPSMGKTAFAMNVAENVALRGGAPVLFVSLEMSGIELADRLLCSVARVNGHRLRNGTISQEDRKRLVDKAMEISTAPLYVDDAPSRTVSEIAAVARRIRQREGRIGMIVIDYLQLIEPDNAKDPRQEQVAKIARRLKGMAREIKVPVLCLAQLNRQAEEGKDHRPRLSHLRESGAIEQDADVVMFVFREEYYREREKPGDHDLEAMAKWQQIVEQVHGKAEVIIGKQRHGPIGTVELAFEGRFTRFGNLAKPWQNGSEGF